MSNKAQSDPRFHDAKDVRCVNHGNAARLKGVKPDVSRTCPACAA